MHSTIAPKKPSAKLKFLTARLIACMEPRAASGSIAPRPGITTNENAKKNPAIAPTQTAQARRSQTLKGIDITHPQRRRIGRECSSLAPLISIFRHCGGISKKRLCTGSIRMRMISTHEGVN